MVDPFRVYLHLAIPSFAETNRRRLRAIDRIKQSAVRFLDAAACRVGGSTEFRFSAWRYPDINKGDVYIRKSAKDQIRSALGPRNVEFHEIEWNYLDAKIADEMVQSCDLFVVGGSAYIFPDAKGEIPDRLRDDLAAIKRLHCPKVAYGIGFNQLMDGEREFAPVEAVPIARSPELRELLNTFDLISVRDARTRDLVDYASQTRRAVLTGDPALFYAGVPSTQPARAQSHKLRIGINFAMHGPNRANLLSKEFPAYREMLLALQRKYDCEFHYVEHAPGERIFKYIFPAHGISVIWHDPAPEDLVATYASFDLHICQMLHSSILSINAGIPTISLGYDVKNVEFFRLMGMADYCHPSANLDLDAVLNSVDVLIRDRAQIAARLTRRKGELRRDLDSFLTAVADLMPGSNRNRA